MNRLAVSVPEAARLIGISPWSYYRRAKAGELPAKTLGRRLIVPLALLQRYLEES